MDKLILNYSSYIEQHPSLKSLLLSVLLIFLFYIIKIFANSSIDKKSYTRSEKIYIKKKTDRYLGFILVGCLFLLWFLQLQVFLVSLLAVAAAFVLAFKELIMCLTGGILVKVSNVFKAGHRIEVDGVRGFVIEKSLLSTKILEIGPENNSQQTTGDIITIPNSLMLSKSIKNESYFKGYSIKAFVFKINDVSSVGAFEKAILAKARKYCEQYIDDAKNGISKFCEKEGIVIPSVSPRTKLIIEDGNEVSVLVKLPVQNIKISEVEQELNRFYLEWRISEERIDAP